MAKKRKKKKKKRECSENIIIFKKIINNPLVDLFYLKYQYRTIFYSKMELKSKIDRNLILNNKFLPKLFTQRKKNLLPFYRNISKNYKIRIMEANAE